ncbi:adenosine deaminase, partial [Streptomyces sp. Wh19]|nr:adenosine deaminase [Streptomyces sp. Wh19]
MISTFRTAHRPKSLRTAGFGALAVLTLLPAIPAAASTAKDPSPTARPAPKLRRRPLTSSTFTSVGSGIGAPFEQLAVVAGGPVLRVSR